MNLPSLVPLKYLDKEVVGKVWRRGLVAGCGGTASSGVVPQTKRSQIRREGQDDEEAAHAQVAQPQMFELLHRTVLLHHIKHCNLVKCKGRWSRWC